MDFYLVLGQTFSWAYSFFVDFFLSEKTIKDTLLLAFHPQLSTISRYADEISIEKAAKMLNHVLGRIAPKFTGKIEVQTDNGAEFSGTTRHYERNYFTQAVESHGAVHRYIHPGHCNANADVESIHYTIEEEFYNLTRFNCRKDFLKKAESYRHFYNLVRPNFSKKGKTPWLIAQEDHPNSDFATLAEMIEVIDLEPKMSLATPGGQALSVLPAKFLKVVCSFF